MIPSKGCMIIQLFVFEGLKRIRTILEGMGSEMIRATAYCRVSTDKEDQLNSLTAQEEYFKKYCIEQGLCLVDIYSDEGISGTKKSNRKAFLQMLQDAQEKKFDYLLVKDISRLARNIIDSIETIRFLKKHIKKVIFVNQPNLTDDEFVLGIMGLIAQQESENLSKRVKFGKKINMEKGKVPNFVYGYDKVEGDYFHLMINEVEAEVVRRIFRYYTKEGYGCSTIAKRLNEEGIPTKQGARWQQISIARILKNELYIGKVINGREEMVEIYSYERKSIPTDKWYITINPEFAIIAEDIFEEAQHLLIGRRDAFVNHRERNSNKYVFSTLIKCSECNSSFRRLQVRNKKKTASWGCNNRNYNGADACTNAKTVKEEELLEAIRAYLCKLYQNRDDMMKWTTEEFKKLYAQKTKTNKSKKSKEKELAELRTKHERQIAMCEKGLISFTEFEKRSAEVKETICQLEEEIKVTDEGKEREENLQVLYNRFFIDIDVMLNATLLSNHMLKKIIDFIEVSPEGQVIIYMKNLIPGLGVGSRSVLNCNNRT